MGESLRTFRRRQRLHRHHEADEVGEHLPAVGLVCRARVGHTAGQSLSEVVGDGGSPRFSEIQNDLHLVPFFPCLDRARGSDEVVDEKQLRGQLDGRRTDVGQLLLELSVESS